MGTQLLGRYSALHGAGDFHCPIGIESQLPVGEFRNRLLRATNQFR